MADAMVTITLRLQGDEYEAVKRFAAKEGSSVNATIRGLLRVALDRCGHKLEPLPEVSRGSR